MSGETERAAAKVLAELGAIVAPPTPYVTVRPDGAGGMIATLWPEVTTMEIASALALWPPGMSLRLPVIPHPDGGVSLLFAPDGG
ncbi:hypothetical protein [Frankia sp. AgW1.1]|uniref:hypothetical protein n=1 Tax=Frankia sp. AgW1.1 TaxID=1836971 RepID=UPI0019344CDD|nr:hypothetical protein [Frankia sp. AgW1.1]MBL7494386.1 hypothetical protein [Frankia sp. AgW1.1]